MNQQRDAELVVVRTASADGRGGRMVPRFCPAVNAFPTGEERRRSYHEFTVTNWHRGPGDYNTSDEQAAEVHCAHCLLALHMGEAYAFHEALAGRPRPEQAEVEVEP